MIAITLLMVIIFSLIRWSLKIITKRSKLPPGPFPLPFIGNLHLLMTDMHLTMDRFSEKYGDMYTLWMADIPFIVITDIVLARKVCLTTKFADRLPLYVGGTVYTRGSKDMIMADYNEALKLHRKLAHSAFVMFGMDNLECIILSNVDSLVKNLSQHIDKRDGCDIREYVNIACFNVISGFVLGDTVAQYDDRYIKIKEAIFLMNQSGVTLSLINFYPILRYWPNKELDEMLKVLKQRDIVLRDCLIKAERDFKPDTVTTYIEALLKAKLDYKNIKGNQNVDDILSRDHIEMNIFDMFLGGVDSTATSLNWAFMYLIKWPQWQVKCQQQIDRAMNNNFKCREDSIRLIHKQHLPYIQAVVFETLRLASTLPFGVFHKAREASEVNGYNIEKGTATMVNIWTIHHKEKNFKDAFEFKPERFLDEHGELAEHCKNLYAFSAGPRECIGKDLAKNEMFLFIANVLHKYNLKSSNKNISLDLHGTTKVTHAPKPYFVEIIKR